MNYMLDTDTCISLLDGREPEKQQNILARLERLHRPELFLSAVTVSELAFGVENSRFRKANLAALDTFLLDFRVMPFDETAAREAGQVRAELEKKGQRIGVMDTLIAGHAKSLGLPLVTNNLADFSRIRSLKVENWSV
jgi:tRNA(fMet)-specific endonuclease VapC